MGKKIVLYFGILLLFFLFSFNLSNAKPIGYNYLEQTGDTVNTFLKLSDTPNTYSGEGGNCVIVSAGENSLSFANCTNGTGGIKQETDPIWTANSTAVAYKAKAETITGSWTYNTLTFRNAGLISNNKGIFFTPSVWSGAYIIADSGAGFLNITGNPAIKFTGNISSNLDICDGYGNCLSDPSGSGGLTNLTNVAYLNNTQTFTGQNTFTNLATFNGMTTFNNQLLFNQKTTHFGDIDLQSGNMILNNNPLLLGSSLFDPYIQYNGFGSVEIYSTKDVKVFADNLTVNGSIIANDWSNVSITESQISDLTHTSLNNVAFVNESNTFTQDQEIEGELSAESIFLNDSATGTYLRTGYLNWGAFGNLFGEISLDSTGTYKNTVKFGGLNVFGNGTFYPIISLADSTDAIPFVFQQLNLANNYLYFKDFWGGAFGSKVVFDMPVINNRTVSMPGITNGTSYTGGSAYVCIYTNGTLFVSESACP